MLICLSVYQEDRCGLLLYLVYAHIQQNTPTDSDLCTHHWLCRRTLQVVQHDHKNLERCQFIVEETWFGARLLLKSFEQMGRFLNPFVCQ